jgi:hypothetical protein
MKNVIAALVAGVIAAVAVVNVIPKSEQVIVERTIKEVEVGAITGPRILSPFLDHNGIVTYSSREAFRTGTTTVCVIKSPSATSTVLWASAVSFTGSTTAATMTIATSTTAFATTSTLVTTSVAANAQNVQAHWLNFGGNNGVLRPNEWITVSLTGGHGTFSNRGACQAEFRVF